MTDYRTEIEKILETILSSYAWANASGKGKKWFNDEGFDCTKEATEATAALLSLLKEAQIKELENILTNSSGGGNWRRTIISRIDQLKSAGIAVPKEELFKW